MLRANKFIKKFIFLFVFNVYKVINVFVPQIFAFVHNFLISVIYYNVYNVVSSVVTGGWSVAAIGGVLLGAWW